LHFAIDICKKIVYTIGVDFKRELHKNILKSREEKTMKNANFKATPIIRTYGAVTYGIENYEGMTEEEIINACDYSNFGGSVCGNICKVYID
jgi:hypothetical protein